ncbi:MAG: trypsin-like serine peptidase [Gemmatimonadaceae bacterium]
MKLTEALLRRAEEALSFDPREERRALLDRTAVAVAEPIVLRHRIAQALGEGSDAAQLAVDRLLSGSDQLNASYLERGMIAADAVARIELRNGESELVGCATGFMVSPHLLLTNHHVLQTADEAAQSWAHFRYEFDALGRMVESCVFALEPSQFFFTDRTLDVTIVAVASETPDRRQRVSRFGWLRLPASPDTIVPGEWLSMVHHPAGRPKQLVLRQNLLIRSSDAELWYVTETASASSGAPVFNDSWQVVAVHGIGAPARDRGGRVLTIDGEPWSDGGDEARIVWRAGVGTRASAIVACLAATNADHPLIAELLADSEVDACDAIVIPLGAGADAPSPAEPDASFRVPHTVAVPSANGAPMRITVPQGNGSIHAPASVSN